MPTHGQIGATSVPKAPPATRATPVDVPGLLILLRAYRADYLARALRRRWRALAARPAAAV